MPKNPPMVIAKQANVTSGPQQVNNGLAREIQTEQSRLLEKIDGKRLDAREASGAVGSDPPLATVGSIHGTADGGREGSC